MPAPFGKRARAAGSVPPSPEQVVQSGA